MTGLALLAATGALTDTSERRKLLARRTGIADWLTGRVTPAWAGVIWIGGGIVLVALAEALR